MQRCLTLRRLYSREAPALASTLLETSVERENVLVQGWVRKAHKKGKISFVHVDDGLWRKEVGTAEGPTHLQVVLPRDVATAPPIGAAVEFTGSWKRSSGSSQAMELIANFCRVLATDEQPMNPAADADVWRKALHLRAKSTAFAALLRLKSRLLLRLHHFFQDRGYVHVDVPVLTANDCEGAGETFTIRSGGDEDFFGGSKQIFLSVSGQLHLEAITSGIARAYTIDTGIRADRSQSRAHLSEFRMLEAETAFCDSLDETCDLVEQLLRCAAEEVTEDDFRRTEMLSQKRTTLNQLAKVRQLPRIRYSEAVEVLKKHEQPMTGGGLTKRNELFLVEHVGSPLFVTHFPTEQKPFYMQRTKGEEHLTDSFDLLAPLTGEIVGGSVRESDAEALGKRVEGNGLEWYEELRRRGKPVSAGFGMGIERLVQTLVGIPNIKDTVAFPRYYHHCQC